MAAGYLSSGTLWAGFEFRNRQQEAALLGAREVGCDLASQCGKTCERGPNASFRPATVAARRSRRTGGSLCPASYHNTAQLLYPYALRTRKSAGLMTRKLSVTESQKMAQFFGTSTRRKCRTDRQKSL